MSFKMSERTTNDATLKEHLLDIDAKMTQVCINGIYSDVSNSLEKLLEHAMNYCHYYTEVSDVLNKTELTSFPIVSKELLNENYDRIKATSILATHTMHTSGSTGVPFSVEQNSNKRIRHIADLKYFGHLAEFKDGDSMCYLRARPTATEESQKQDNIWQLDISNLNQSNLKKYYDVIIRKKCVALMGYPSTLETAVDFWNRQNANETNIKTVISTSETLTESVKQKIKDYFGKETLVYARYSNTENGILGQETIEHGVFCLNWASYFFEIIKMDSDEPAELGELGRIVVTDLYNYKFPMIRYDTGDVGKFVIKSTSTVPMLSDLYGRKLDLVYDTEGEVVSPLILCRIIRLSKDIVRWQFVQEDQNKYTLKIKTKSNCCDTFESLVTELTTVLGDGSQIIIQLNEFNDILPSLKRKLIRSKLKK